ncbi:MAG: DUF6512 family protein [Chloroflexota bacterium]
MSQEFQRQRRKLLLWEIGSFIFIGLFGAGLHFVFELSEFWSPIGWFGAVNESTWEHLKLVFWPAVIFSLIEYTYVRDSVRNYLFAKAVSTVVMMAIIVATWYIYTPITGNINWFNIAIFYVAVFIGQIISYRLLTAEAYPQSFAYSSLAVFVVLCIAFVVFTYFPPRFSLFEHYDLLDTNEYGILDDYEDLRVFR